MDINSKMFKYFLPNSSITWYRDTTSYLQYFRVSILRLHGLFLYNILFIIQLYYILLTINPIHYKFII